MVNETSRLALGSKVSAHREYSRRTSRNVGVGLESDFSSLCCARLCCSLFESSWLERLWPKIFRRHLERMGRWRLQRLDGGRRRSVKAKFLDRSGPPGSYRRLLRRLYDELDYHADVSV